MFTPHPTIKRFNLKTLAKERPVIKEALNHALNPDCYSKENKDMQWKLELMVGGYQDAYMIDDYELSIAEIGVIMMSCCETLRWLHRHPTHAWKEPMIRLLDVLLDNHNVEKEKEDYKEVYKRFDPLTYL